MSLTARRRLCLDLMKVSWAGTQGSTHSDCAILLEIAPDGGLLQTTVAIPCGSEITLTVGRGSVQGQVTSCEQDDYGHVINFLVVAGNTDWYPGYVPPFMLAVNRQPLDPDPTS
jgi:hypothetical protein